MRGRLLLVHDDLVAGVPQLLKLLEVYRTTWEECLVNFEKDFFIVNEKVQHRGPVIICEFIELSPAFREVRQLD